ncbi:MAG: hypothetical protein WBZ33_01140, partial [Thermoactinomyces sp.]
MLLPGLYMQNARNGEQLYYILADMHLIDVTLIRYPALMVFISGVLLSIWTQWGLIKYYWVVIKFALTLLIILIGILFLGDWLSFLLETANHLGLDAFQKHDFQTTSWSLIFISAFNILAMALMTCITYFKPFGKIKKRRITKS